jgi:Tfp pilus assembly protein PilO
VKSKPRTSKRRYNSWFVTVPLLAGSLAFVFWFYRPTQGQISDMRAELQEKQLVLATATSLPADLERATRELAETRGFVAAWRKTAMQRKLAEVCGDLASFVAAAGARTTKLEPEPALRYQCLTKTPLLLAYEGTFPQVCRVLQRIEQMPETLWIEDLRITREGKEAGSVACVLKLAIFAGQSNLADKTD